MINRVDFSTWQQPAGPSLSRIETLKNKLREQDTIEFRFRANRYTGTVINLGLKSMEVTFQLSGNQVVRKVPYEGVIRILS